MISATWETLLALPTSVWFCLAIVFLVARLTKRNDENETRKKLESQGLKPFESIPKPPRWPIIGNMHLLREYEHDHWAGLDMIRDKWGDIVNLKMGQLTMVMISSHEIIRELLIDKGKTFSNRPGFDRLEIVFGSRSHSLALCDYNDIHRDRRKMCKRGIIPISESPRNKLMEQTTIKHTKLWSARFEKDLAEHKEVRITKTESLFMTGAHFLDFLTGETRERSDKDYQEFNYGADFLFWEIQQSYLVDFFPSLKWVGLSRSQLKRLGYIAQKMRNYIDKDVWNPHLEKQIALFQNKDEFQDRSNDLDKMNFLDSMINDYLQKASLLSLEDYQLGFADLYGGHAAVANMLIRTLGHLSLEPDIQEKVYEEANRVNIDQVSQVPNLVFSEAVIQETLRIASSPIVPHVAKVDGSLGGYFIPAKTTILINNYYLNRSDKLWDKPLEWNPSRFIDSNGQLKLPAHFIPFSVGARSCLGYKMVVDICTFVCSYVCKKFYLEPNDAELTKKLLRPQGMLGLNPDVECFEVILKARS